jgi:hypothetical protein
VRRARTALRSFFQGVFVSQAGTLGIREVAQKPAVALTFTRR